MRSNVGSMSIALAIVAPLLVALIALIVNIGTLLHARAKLQIAVDRGVYAGAASLAHSLNRIARKNWEIHSEFARLRRMLDEDSLSDESYVAQQIAAARARQSSLYGEMNDINTSMLIMALEKSSSVVASNISDAVFVPFESVLASNVVGLSMEEGVEGSGAAYDNVTGSDIVGEVLFDPESYEVEAPERMLRYLHNNEAREVFFGGKATVLTSVPIFPSLFGSAVKLTAAAGAQPYGGSFEEFARVDPLNDEPPDFNAREHLYRVALVPVQTVTNEEPAALH